MSETLWASIPLINKNSLENVISSISNKNLPSLSINQLIKKLEKDEAADWVDVLKEYDKIPALDSNIPGVRTLPYGQMLSRSRGVRDKFAEKGFSNLQDQTFKPRELLSLIILSYSNPSLIGKNLCKALNDNKDADAKTEMIEFSAYSSRENRMLPSQSNFRLLSTALYFNDTDIRLPQRAIERVKNETIRDGRDVILWDERGDVHKRIDAPEGASNDAAQEITPRKKRNVASKNVSKIDSHQIFQSLQPAEPVTGKDATQSQLAMPASAPQIAYSGNESELVTEPLALHSANNAASAITNRNLVAGLVGLHIFRNLPVISPVMNNMGKDLKRAGQYVGNLFAKDIESEQQQETTVLSPTVRS